jgi:hypothetical protein
MMSPSKTSAKKYFFFLTLKWKESAMHSHTPRGCMAGLPDGIHILKTKIWENFEELGMEDAGIFYGHLVYFVAIGYKYFVAIGYILLGNLVYLMVIWFIFSRFGMLYQEKSGNPGCTVSFLRRCKVK